MKKKKVLSVSLLMLFLTSCSNVSMRTNSATLTTTASADFKAKVTVGEKIEGTGSVVYLLGLLPLTVKTYEVSGVLTGSSDGGASLIPNPITMVMSLLPPTDIAKDEAAYNAVTQSGCDVLVDPVYEMVTTNFLLFKSQTCKVTGYRGTIESWVQQ